MSVSIQAAGPFDMLIDPQAILNAIERSECLQGLARKVCRPLDKPTAPKTADGASAAVLHDDVIDRMDDDASLI